MENKESYKVSLKLFIGVILALIVCFAVIICCVVKGQTNNIVAENNKTNVSEILEENKENLIENEDVKNIKENAVNNENNTLVEEKNIETNDKKDETDVKKEVEKSKENSEFAGTWKSYKFWNSEKNKWSGELQELFGTSIKYGSKLILNSDGTFSDYVRPLASEDAVTDGAYYIDVAAGNMYVVLEYNDGKTKNLKVIKNSANDMDISYDLDGIEIRLNIRDDILVSNENEKNDSDFIVGKWNTKKFWNSDANEWSEDLMSLFGSSIRYGSSITFFEDGTFEEYLSPVTETTKESRGKYIVGAAAGKTVIELEYNDGKEEVISVNEEMELVVKYNDTELILKK